jgi:VanZ family protein
MSDWLSRSWSFLRLSWRRLEAAPLWLRIGLALGWAALIWQASSWKPSRAPEPWLVSYCRNGAHVVIFGVLAALVHVALRAAPRRAAATFLLVVLYAVVDEVHQGYVPGRHPSVFDLVSDAVGALWALAVLDWLQRGGRTRTWRVAACLPLAVLAAYLATTC